MTISLVNLMLWPALLLGVLPLLLHLFARSKPPKYQFSSIEFILRIVRSTVRLKRPKDWLLLLIRTLLIVAVVLAFLRPLFFSQGRLAGHGSAKNTVLIVDASASMAYVDGAQTRFAVACAEAAEVLAGLSANDTANIVWLDSKPASIFPEMGGNIGYLRNSLRKAQVTGEAGAIDDAIRMAVDLFEDAAGKNEICIISDFQESAWGDAALRVPDGIDLVRVKVGEKEAANGAISAIGFRPATPLAGERCTLFCEVNNFSPEPRRRTVFLQVGESRQSQTLLIPAWGQGVASFEHRFNASGVFPVKAELDEDGYAGDDQRLELVEVNESIRLGVLGAESPSGRVWMRALQALEWVDAAEISFDPLEDKESWDLVVLSDWQGEYVEEIRELLKTGCGLFCLPGEGAPHESLARLVGAGSEANHGTAGLIEFEESLGVRLQTDSSEAFELFARSEYGDPLPALFKSRLQLPQWLVGRGTLLAEYEDGGPALISIDKDGGERMIWNMTLDPARSDWAGRVEFLPLIAELVLSSAREQEPPVDSSLHPAERALWHIDREVPASEVVLKGPDGEVVPVEARQADGGVDFVSGGLRDMGLYRWEHNSKPAKFHAVNFPPVESDLRTLDIGELQRGGNVAVLRGSTVRRLRDGFKLWPYLLATSLGLAFLEMGILVWGNKQ